jgi:hypothetical protein
MAHMQLQEWQKHIVDSWKESIDTQQALLLPRAQYRFRFDIPHKESLVYVLSRIEMHLMKRQQQPLANFWLYMRDKKITTTTFHRNINLCLLITHDRDRNDIYVYQNTVFLIDLSQFDAPLEGFHQMKVQIQFQNGEDIKEMFPDSFGLVIAVPNISRILIIDLAENRNIMEYKIHYNPMHNQEVQDTLLHFFFDFFNLSSMLSSVEEWLASMFGARPPDVRDPYIKSDPFFDVLLNDYKHLMTENYWTNNPKLCKMHGFPEDDRIFLLRLLQKSNLFDSRTRKFRLEMSQTDLHAWFLRTIVFCHDPDSVLKSRHVLNSKPINGELWSVRLFATSKLVETDDFAVDRDHLQVYKELYTRSARATLFKDVFSVLDTMVSVEDEDRIRFGVRWSSRDELFNWSVLMYTVFHSNLLEASPDTFLDIKVFFERNKCIWLTQRLDMLKTDNVFFVWSDQCFKTLKQRRVFFSSVLTVQDFIDEFGDVTTSDEPFCGFLVNNKKQGFYTFDAARYHPSLLFPTRVTGAQHARLKTGAEDGLETPELIPKEFFFALQKDLLRHFVLFETDSVSLSARWRIFCALWEGLTNARETIKTQSAAFICTFAEFDDSSLQVFSSRIDVLFGERVGQMFSFVQDTIDSAARTLYVDKQLFWDLDEVREIPAPLQSIDGMNARAEIVSALSDLEQNMRFPDVMRVLFSESRAGDWVTRLPAVWIQEGYQSLKQVVRVQDAVDARGKAAHRVLWVQQEGSACFRFCVTMHIEDRARAAAVYKEWYDKTFVKGVPIYLKQLFGFVRVKPAEDESAGWAV